MRFAFESSNTKRKVGIAAERERGRERGSEREKRARLFAKFCLVKL